jgi:glycosyltransferase 2 family protein
MDSVPQGQGKRNAVWPRVIPTVLAPVLLYFALRGVEWGRVWSTIATARWSHLVAAALISCASFFLRSYRWRILLNAEARLAVATVFWANMAGYLGNNFLPARAGEVIRSMLISGRSTLSRTYVLTTALSERLMDVIALTLLTSIVLLGVHPKPRWMAEALGIIAVVAGAGAIAILVLPHTGNLLANVLRRIHMPGGPRDRLLRLAEQIVLGMRAFHDWRRMGAFIALTGVIWTLDAFTASVAARGLGIELAFPVAMLLLMGLGLGSALPSTPGYVGVYQFAAVTVLTPFGISRDSALAYILVAQATGYVVILALSLPGLYILRGHTGLETRCGDDSQGTWPLPL